MLESCGTLLVTLPTYFESQIRVVLTSLRR